MVCIPSSSNISSHQVSITLGLSWWENSSPNIFDTSLCGRTFKICKMSSPSQRPIIDICESAPNVWICLAHISMTSVCYIDGRVLNSNCIKLKATKGDQCKPDRFLKRIWIDYPRFFLNKYMDGCKNVSISHILPGERYASPVDSWISTWTGGVTGGLVKISPSYVLHYF